MVKLFIRSLRAGYNINIYLWVILLSMLAMAVEARLDLQIFRPAEEFVTNNKELMIAGLVKFPEVQRVAISVNAPAGVPDLGSLAEPLQTLVVDLGASFPLQTLAVLPVFEGGLSLGPRVVNLSFSEDGQAFVDRGVFNVSSGTEQGLEDAQAEFGAAIQARFVQIDMLDGWQAGRISVQEVGFLNTTGELLKGKIRGISIALDLDENGEAHFQIELLLKEGENQIFIAAKALDSIQEIEEKFEVIMATYIPEVVITDEPLTLSDGYKAELVIPTSALSPEIKKIGIHPLDVNEIDWTSYANNLRIERDTSPVMAYEVQVSVATPFPATAKDSLDRQPPGLAVDGNPEYPSTWMTTVSALPVWFKVDLRESRSVGKVVIRARVEDDVSYGPKRATVLVSDDDVNYLEVGMCDECGNDTTEIELPTTPVARYVQILIKEGRQGNNIQINEIELFDDEGARIVSYVKRSSAILARPAELTLLYDDTDLVNAGVKRVENLAIFSWNEGMREWTMAGGKVDLVNGWVAVNLNYLSTFAIFEATAPMIEVRWNFNPFSPNGDGIADTTTISINMAGEAEEQVRVEIFDHVGKLVRTLVHEDLQTGNISIVWDGRDENGDMVSIGPYIYQVRVGNEIRNGVLVVAR